MEHELIYERNIIRKRHLKYIDKIERWKEDIKMLIQLLLEQQQEEKAKQWVILLQTLELSQDLWNKLVREL